MQNGILSSMAKPQQYEVEVKVLLGDEKTAAKFLAALAKADPNFAKAAETNQLNHYFKSDGNKKALLDNVGPMLKKSDRASLEYMLNAYQDVTVRTRQANGSQILAIKAAKNGQDKDHALIRAEGDYTTNYKTIDELDAKVLAAGYTYLSKWSRWRRTYDYKDFTVMMDRNAGYGFVAEIELVVASENEAQTAKDKILAELSGLGFEELPQDRLGRMFAHYNQYWPEYYQTDKIFNVE
jgi:adenylate cyclase class IV